MDEIKKKKWLKPMIRWEQEVLPVPLMPEGRILESYFPGPRMPSKISFSFSRKFSAEDSDPL